MRCSVPAYLTEGQLHLSSTTEVANRSPEPVGFASLALASSLRYVLCATRACPMMPKAQKKKKGPKWYGVRRGRQPGIYETWSEAEKQVRRTFLLVNGQRLIGFRLSASRELYMRRSRRTMRPR